MTVIQRAEVGDRLVSLENELAETTRSFLEKVDFTGTLSYGHMIFFSFLFFSFWSPSLFTNHNLFQIKNLELEVASSAKREAEALNLQAQAEKECTAQLVAARENMDKYQHEVCNLSLYIWYDKGLYIFLFFG